MEIHQKNHQITHAKGQQKKTSTFQQLRMSRMKMMSNMRKSGFDKDAMMQVFKERKAKLNKALEEYEKKTESLPIILTCH